MKKILLLGIFTILLQAKVYDGVAVVVKDQAITMLDIQKEMQKSHLGVKQATDKLIRQKLEAAEIKERKITVSSSEVYDDIKAMAKRNHMNISDFYDAVREANGLSSMQLKEEVRKKLLSQKLYQSIAYASMQEPSEQEIQEYYNLHKEDFIHPASFTVIIYDADDREILQEKVDNPMFYSPKIRTNEQVLPYNRISPELASLLEKTEVGSFTPVIPNGKGGFMSFYIKSQESAKDAGLENVRAQIVNAILAQKREVILSDYFARLRDNADINIIRIPK